MNISISSKRAGHTTGLGLALRAGAVFGLLIFGLAVTGALGGKETNRTHAHTTAVAVERATSEAQFVYYIVDSQQAAASAAIAESVTAQERVLAGTMVPERIVVIIDDSEAGHVTAAEAMLVAQ